MKASNLNNFSVKSKQLSGSNYAEVKKSAERLFTNLKRKTKRTPYIRSAYFDKEKIFLNYFWDHLKQKSLKEKTRRLKLFPCAIELIKNSRNEPSATANRHKKSEMLYRFVGRLSNRQVFYVQIKKNIKSNKKYLMSFFPE